MLQLQVSTRQASVCTQRPARLVVRAANNADDERMMQGIQKQLAETEKSKNATAKPPPPPTANKTELEAAARKKEAQKWIAAWRSGKSAHSDAERVQRELAKTMNVGALDTATDDALRMQYDQKFIDDKKNAVRSKMGIPGPDGLLPRPIRKVAPAAPVAPAPVAAAAAASSSSKAPAPAAKTSDASKGPVQMSDGSVLYTFK